SGSGRSRRIPFNQARCSAKSAFLSDCSSDSQSKEGITSCSISSFCIVCPGIPCPPCVLYLSPHYIIYVSTTKSTRSQDLDSRSIHDNKRSEPRTSPPLF